MVILAPQDQFLKHIIIDPSPLSHEYFSNVYFSLWHFCFHAVILSGYWRFAWFRKKMYFSFLFKKKKNYI